MLWIELRGIVCGKTLSGLVRTYQLSFAIVVVLRQDLSVALEPVLVLALVDQVGLKLREIHLPLPPTC